MRTYRQRTSRTSSVTSWSLTDTGIHLPSSVPIDSAGDLPDGCVPTEKVQALAVALCGEVYGGLQVLGKRILVNDGSGWTQLIGLPTGSRGPRSAWRELDVGCAIPLMGETGSRRDGRANARCRPECSCRLPTVRCTRLPAKSETRGKADRTRGSSVGVPTDLRWAYSEERTQPAVARLPPSAGSISCHPTTWVRATLLLPLTPSQSVFRWTSVDDQRSASNRSGARRRDHLRLRALLRPGADRR